MENVTHKSDADHLIDAIREEAESLERDALLTEDAAASQTLYIIAGSLRAIIKSFEERRQ